MQKTPVILGPTACGKTAVAAHLAYELDGEVISADSRQVYRGMDIGSGKDLCDYMVEGRTIPYHLIDIADPGYEYNIFEYQKDFAKAYTDIVSRGKLPVLCGGSGMYLEAVLKGYSLPEAPTDPAFADKMQEMDDASLLQELRRLKKLHSTTDTTDRNRMLRALEIELKRRELGISDGVYQTLNIPHPASAERSEAFISHQQGSTLPHPASAERSEAFISHQQGSALPHPASAERSEAFISHQQRSALPHPVIFGINPGREIVRRRITSRLQARLENGMLQEVSKLLTDGVPAARLKAYGLEYKYLTQYLGGELSYDEMFRLLNTAIHQFAKRQMTWFRRMERQGFHIHWMEGEMTSAEYVKKIREILK